MQDEFFVECECWAHFCRDVVGCVRGGGWARWGLGRVWLGPWVAGRGNVRHMASWEWEMMYVCAWLGMRVYLIQLSI